MYKFVTVKFNNSNGRYDYLCEDDDVRRGDLVRVLTARGEQVVEVVKVFYSDGNDLELPLSKYKSILGKSTSPVAQETYGPKRFVNVIFNNGSYEYSYACADPSIGEGSYVYVWARHEQKIAKVVSVYYSDTDNYRPIIREAREDEIKKHVYDFVADDDYFDSTAEDGLFWEDAYHDYDLDEDDWAIVHYCEVYLPEYKHTDYFRYDDSTLLKGDIVEVPTPLGTGEGVVRRLIYKLYKDMDEELGTMRKIVRKVRDNPDAAARAVEQKKNEAAIKAIEERSSKGLDRGWARVEKNNNAVAQPRVNYEPVKPQYVEEHDVEGVDENLGVSYGDLIYDPQYFWHPMNIYHDDKEPKYDHNRMTDEHGWMVNGKWLAEHERNQSNPGSPFDSRGYAKNFEYEECLKYGWFPEDATEYMTDEEYSEWEAKNDSGGSDSWGGDSDDSDE